MSSPSIRKAAIAGFVLIVAAGAVLLWRGTPSPDEATAGSASGTSSSTTAAAGRNPAAPSGQPAAPQEPPKPREQIPVPGCWEGVLAFDKAASMENFRAVLAQAIANRDRDLAVYLEERLTELVGNDAARALQVLEWAKGSSQPELGVYMEALKKTQAVHDPKVVEGLLAMGEDKAAALENRAAALSTLETQKRLTSANIQRIKAIAMDETVDSVAWMAARTLGRVMKEDFESTGTYAPYWNELLDIGASSKEPAVRELALEMPSYSNPLLDSASIDELAEIMRNDPERGVREMAAFRLAVTEDPQKALEAYRAAFDGERELCVRWAMLRFAVRAAGQDALPLVAEFARKDPRLQADYQDFKDLYAQGTVDFSRIWLGKQERHDCTVEEGAPH